MQYIADAGEAKEIDRISIDEIGIPSMVLMERAALKVADCVSGIADAGRDRVLVVCGSGNNGGDGVAAGRILSERGFEVAVVFAGDRDRASVELREQLAVAERLSVPVAEKLSVSGYSVIIDAIFGIGLSREVTGMYGRWIEQINQAEAAVVSVDIPSGIDATTGEVLGTAVRADYTVTFGVNKRGLVLFPGTQYAGKVLVEDIGFPGKAVHRVSPAAVALGRDDVRRLFPERIPRSNKGSYGRVLVIAGSEQISGAAFFAASAAYQMGSGLVRVLTHENNRCMLQVKLPEALIGTYRGGEDSGRDGQDGELARQMDDALSWATAVVVGPGLGTSPTAEYLLRRVLEISEIPVVIDADGLNLLAGFSEYFDREGRIGLPENFVLTPHLKEMSRLSGAEVADIKRDVVGTAFFGTDGAAVVLKDARTVVSDGKRICINCSGNNALAKGGTGDVLSGMIGGLLARGMEPFMAAALGVYLHGLTAEEYVKEGSYSTMLASDILAGLPRILP